MEKLKTLLLLKLFLGILACSSCFDQAAFVEKYFQDVYQPVYLDDEMNRSFPDEHFISELTWFCYQKNHLCQSSTLQMIAGKHSINKPLEFYSFLLGYTYGAMYVKGAGMFAAYSDPEPGYILAADYLGLDRKYLVTDNQQVLLRNIRYFLSKGFPVRIAWNSAMTMKYAMESGYFPRPVDWKEPAKNAFSPHSVVFVGYDSNSFYYYETHGKNFILEGEKGIQIDDSSVAQAIVSFSSTYRLPWRYMMTIFEEDSSSADLNKIWERNGEEMIGRVLGPTSTGSYAIRGLADGVKKEGIRIFQSPKKEMFIHTIQTLIEIRTDNAFFLEHNFRDDSDALKAAKLLHMASENYQTIVAILQKDNLTKQDAISISRLLDLSAEAEQEAGEIFIVVSRKQHLEKQKN